MHDTLMITGVRVWGGRPNMRFQRTAKGMSTGQQEHNKARTGGGKDESLGTLWLDSGPIRSPEQPRSRDEATA